MHSRDFLAKLECHLHKVDDIELVVLKGHLILEQALNQMLLGHIDSEKSLNDLSLTFSKKLDLLVALTGGGWEEEVSQLREVNRIRNKLAHQLEFKPFHPALKKWACCVVGYTPRTLNDRRTFRNTLSKAFYLLCGILVGRASVLQDFRERPIK